jgi:hypothetical protein
MTVRNLRTIASLFAVALFLIVLTTGSARAQENAASGPGAFVSRPSIGLQTIFFGKDSPPAISLSPGDDRDVIGGGFSSANNAVRVVVELIPDANGMWRIPLSFEAYQFIGKTTFAVPIPNQNRKLRWLFRHDATMFSVGTGVTAAFFSKPNLYINLEGKLNYLPPATFYNRQYYSDNNQTYREKEVDLQDEARTRFGGFARVGTQVDFFDPFLLDFSVGYGVINAFGKETDPVASRHLLTIDDRSAPEGTIGYFGFGLSLIWEM